MSHAFREDKVYSAIKENLESENCENDYNGRQKGFDHLPWLCIILNMYYFME